MSESFNDTPSEAVTRELDKILNGDNADNLESETIDFKAFPKKRDGRIDRDKLNDLVIEYSVSFANKNGGIQIFGVENTVNGRDAFTGCLEYDLKEIQRQVYNCTHPPLSVDVESIEYAGVRIILVSTRKSEKIHSTNKGIIFQRVGKENRTRYPEDFTNLYVEKGNDFTRGILYDISRKDIDDVEVKRLRNWYSHYKPRDDLSSYSDDALLEMMDLIHKDKNDTFVPSAAGLLLVGKVNSLKKAIPQHEIIFQRYEADDINPVHAITLNGPLLNIIEKIISFIEPYNSEITIEDSFLETPIPSFPNEVLREGLLNAVVHRDYSIEGSVIVKLFKNRIEISNPGGFLGDITPDNIITHPPTRRNPSLAEAFQHLGAVNRAGRGVDRMYYQLISYGKMPPEYLAFTDSVTLIIRNGTIDEKLAKFISAQAKNGHGWELNELIVIHHLRLHQEVSLNEIVRICQITRQSASALVSKMEGVFIERSGKGPATSYHFTRSVYQFLDDKARYTRVVGLDENRMTEMILQHLEEYGRITNNEVRSLCGLDRYQAGRLLHKISTAGKIFLVSNKRGSFYHLPGKVPKNE